MSPEQFDPQDDDTGAPHDHVKPFEGLLQSGWEPRGPLYQELDIGLHPTEIDALGIRSSIEGVVIVWHAIDHARSWLMSD
jgi:hypothetical protein